MSEEWAADDIATIMIQVGAWTPPWLAEIPDAAESTRFDHIRHCRTQRVVRLTASGSTGGPVFKDWI